MNGNKNKDFDYMGDLRQKAKSSKALAGEIVFFKERQDGKGVLLFGCARVVSDVNTEYVTVQMDRDYTRIHCGGTFNIKRADLIPCKVIIDNLVSNFKSSAKHNIHIIFKDKKELVVIPPSTYDKLEPYYNDKKELSIKEIRICGKKIGGAIKSINNISESFEAYIRKAITHDDKDFLKDILIGELKEENV